MTPEETSSFINQFCAPLFIGNYYMIDGHDASTTSASATFVRFENVDYVVTCNHVRELATRKEGLSARLQAGRTAINLSNWSAAGLTSGLKNLGDEADVSICRLGNWQLELLSSSKSKLPIDLDNFQEPNWENISYCIAAGFPNRAKSIDTESAQVSSPMVEALVKVDDPIRPVGDTFCLHSRLDRKIPYGFSGMSGGPVFSLRENLPPLPIGIIFEGQPSGEEPERPADAIFDDYDIFVRAHFLTPTIFERWLRHSGLKP